MRMYVHYILYVLNIFYILYSYILCMGLFILDSFFTAPAPKSPVFMKDDGNSDKERESSDDYEADRYIKCFPFVFDPKLTFLIYVPRSQFIFRRAERFPKD